MKFILPFLLLTQVAFGAPKLQDADFMSAAQLVAAGGTAAQLLNDTKMWSSVLGQQISTALGAGAIANDTLPFLMNENGTPANPAALFHKLYFKADGNLYMLDSAGVEAQVNGGAAPSGTPNTFAGFDGAGALFTIPGFGIQTSSGAKGVAAQETFVVPVDGTPATPRINFFETEFNAANPSTDQNPIGFSTDNHFDRTGSGNNMNSLTGFNNVLSHEGNGTLQSMSGIENSVVFGAGANVGTVVTGIGQINTNTVGNGFTVNNLQGLVVGNNIQAGGVVTDATLGSFNGSGDVTNNFSGLSATQNGNVGGAYLNYRSGLNGNVAGNATEFQSALNGSVGGSYGVLSSTEIGVITGNYNGIFLSQDGDAGNYTGLTLTKVSGNATSVEGFRFNYSNGTATSKSAFTAIMGDGATSGGGRFLDLSRGAGSYDNFIGLNLNDGSGNTTTSETGVNLGQASGTSASYTGVNLTANGTTGDWEGVNIGGAGTATAGVKGLNINLGGFTSPTMKLALNTSEGALNVNGFYDTSLYGSPGAFSQLNNIGGQFVVPSGSPITGSAFIGANLATGAGFADDMGPDAFGGILGYSYVGFFGVLNVAAGKTVDHMNAAFAAISNQGGSGTVTSMDMYMSGGLISGGGTVTAGTLSNFHVLNGSCANVTGDCFGVNVQDATANNFYAGKSVFGGAFAAPTYAVEVNGSALIRNALRLEDPGVGLNDISILAPTPLAASYTLTLPVDAGTVGQVLATDGTGLLSWVPNGSPTQSTGYEPETFTLDGGVTFDADINGIRRAENNKTIQKIVVCLSNSGVSGTTTVRVNYGPALASSTTVSVAATGGAACNSTTPAIALVTNDLMNADVTAVANGVPLNLSVKIIF